MSLEFLLEGKMLVHSTKTGHKLMCLVQNRQMGIIHDSPGSQITIQKSENGRGKCPIFWVNGQAEDSVWARAMNWTSLKSIKSLRWKISFAVKQGSWCVSCRSIFYRLSDPDERFLLGTAESPDDFESLLKEIR